MDIRKGQRYRTAAFITFFTGLLVFVIGGLVAAYFGRGLGGTPWVLVALLVGGALFLATLVLGGIGWGQFKVPGREESAYSTDMYDHVSPPYRGFHDIHDVPDPYEEAPRPPEQHPK